MCVCVVAASGCVLVSLSGTHLHKPPNYNSLKQPEQQMTDPHTYNTEPNPQFRVLDLLQLSIAFHMIFQFIAHNSKQQLLLECVCVGP